MWIYLFYIVAFIMLPNYRVGPLSVRVYISILMMFVMFINSLRNQQNTYIKNANKKYIVLYVAFLLFMTISCLANGEIYEMNYLNLLLGSYLIPLVVYYATLYYVRDEKAIKKVVVILGAIVIVDSIVTILQFYNNPIGWVTAAMFHGGNVAEWQENVINRFASADSMIGNSYQVGIFAYGFINAAFLCSIPFLFLYPVFNSKNGQYHWFLKLFCLAAFSIGLIACFMTQQRAAFIGMCLLLVYLLVKFNKNKVLTYVIIIVGIIIISFNGLSSLQSDSLGRVSSFDGMANDSRYSIWTRTVDYLFQHPLWGGHIGLGIDPHNLFLNAFVYGGFFGGVVMSFLVLSFSLDSLKIIVKKASSFRIFAAGALLVYTFSGLFHNVSIVDGSDLAFLFLALLSLDNSKYSVLSNHN